MNWKKKLLKNFKLYAITDLDREEKSIFRKIDQALEGGAGLIQLRSKTLLDAAFLRLALKIAPRVGKRGGLFFINDRVHVALVCGDGVHLGQDDLPYHYARRILGNTKFIGRSTHSLDQALQAEREGHDYIG
ncbi:MAG: thiamine phosphate synthase, partial [Candidatus Omnitrophica bacterium]|nr:thiamine phosphate synthase [Candidatus Omnitrophota bacterium]